MHVGLVVYSWSGHTRHVAERLREQLMEKGRAVTLVSVEVVGERPQGSRTFELPEPHDLSLFDAIVFGAGVEAFSLSPVMKEYLRRAVGLEGKRTACLVTQQFPFAWMGGNRAIRQMKRLVERKGARVIGSAVVHWSASRREASIASGVARLGEML